MDTTGSIKASLKGGNTGFHPQNIEPAVLERAKQFLESLQFDLRIRQMLYPDKMEVSLSNHVYYVLGNEQKFEPGFLICMKGAPVIFVNSRLTFGFTLRLRLHASLYEKEAVFIGTLDTVHAQLRLEDVLYYSGRRLTRDGYSQRYKVLQEFIENSFVQDKRLSGLMVTVAEPTPLASLKETIDSGQYYSVDLIPEQGGRRRWHIPLHAPVVRSVPVARNVAVSVPVPVSRNAPVDTPTVIVSTTIPEIIEKTKTHATATKVVGSPDTYDLRDEEDKSMGRAAVQNSAVSIQLREAFTKSGVKHVAVRIQWYEDFKRYKIIGLYNGA
jgi:hypothetical protein